MSRSTAMSSDEPYGARDESQPEVINNLRDLVAALERRAPRIERDDEQRIAREAEALKARALERLTQLEAGRTEP